jgi:hypothetical protein
MLHAFAVLKPLLLKLGFLRVQTLQTLVQPMPGALGQKPAHRQPQKRGKDTVAPPALQV